MRSPSRTLSFRTFLALLALFNINMLLAILVSGSLLLKLSLQPPEQQSESLQALVGQWGTATLTILLLHMLMGASFPLPFVANLLSWHLQLCWKRLKTGEFHSTYMYLRSSRTGEMNGRGAFQDQRAEYVLRRLADYHFMDQHSAWRIWVAHTEAGRFNRTAPGMSDAMGRTLSATSRMLDVHDMPTPEELESRPPLLEGAGAV